ncbi:MAG: hypothetical protein WBW48_17285 [Anaerolineae bacterium]
MLNDFLFNLPAKLAYDLLKTSMTRLHNAAFGDAEQQALRRIYERAFAAMLKAMAPSDDQDTLRHLDSVLRPLLQSPDVSSRLMDIALVKDYRPSIPDLRARFQAAGRALGRDLASLASIQADLDVGLAAFIPTLSEELREEAGRPDGPLHNRVVVRQLDSLHEQHKEITLLVQQVLAGQSESAEKLRKIEQEILVALERAIGQRIVKIDGDVSGSIIITGDGNRVQWLDGGDLAEWWKGSGSNPETLLPQYLNVVAKAHTDLDFPLGHLPQSIPLSEVYVDLPIVKPPIDEVFLRPLRPGERWSGETIPRIDQLLQRSERSALVGLLGTGKTTTLRYLTWIYAQRPEDKYYWRSERLVPFYARLRDLAEIWTKTERITPERFMKSLATASARFMGGAFPARSIEIILQHELREGNALVLLDALDEYKPPEPSERSDFVGALQNLWCGSDFFKNNHILLTSRPYGFSRFGQYGLQDLDDAECLVFQLGEAILKRSRSDLSKETIESWLELLNEAVSQPRFRGFFSPLYITLMVYLGTSEKTAEESILLLNDIKHLADPYRYFLRKTIEWEEKKGNEPGVDPGTALLVLGYTAYDTFAESHDVEYLDIANELQTSKKEVTSVQKFWKRTGLLWEDEVRGTLGFRHSGFQAFGVAFALTDMALRSKVDKVKELLDRYRWEPYWNETINPLLKSLSGEKRL